MLFEIMPLYKKQIFSQIFPLNAALTHFCRESKKDGARCLHLDNNRILNATDQTAGKLCHEGMTLTAIEQQAAVTSPHSGSPARNQ